MTEETEDDSGEGSGDGSEQDVDGAGFDLDGVNEVLRAKFYEWRELRPAGHIYVLLDPNHPTSPYDMLDLGDLAERPVQRHIETVPRPDLAHEPDLLPRLLQVYAAGESGYADEELLELVLLCAFNRCRSVNGAYVAGWLLSEAAPDQLARHLASAGTMFDMGCGKERFVPLFEPYRLALLHDGAAAAALLKRWLGPVEHWLFIDSAAELRCLNRHDCSAGDEQQRAARLTRAQSAAQERVRLARLVVMALARSGTEVPPTPELRIDACLIRAHAFGLSDTEDVLFCALNDFTLGPAWTEHAEAAAAIRRVAADPQLGLAAQFNALSDEVLEQIAEGRGSR